MRDLARRLGGSAAVFALMWVVAALVYLPDVRAFTTGFLGRVSYGAYQGTLWWYAHVLANAADPGAWLASDLQLYPFGMKPYLSYTGDVLAAFLFAPFAALLPLNQATNAFVLSALAANGAAAWWAVRSLGGGRLAALAAGALLTCNPYADLQLEHGRLSLLLMAPMPLFVGCWIRAFGPRPRLYLTLSVLALWATVLIYPYYGVFLALAAPPLVLVAPRPREGIAVKLVVLLVGAGVLSLGPMLPLLADYGQVTDVARDCQAYAPCATDLPADFGATFMHSVWTTHWGDHAAHPLLWACLIGLVGPRRVRWLAGLGLLAWVMAHGPYLVGRTGPSGFGCVSGAPLPYWLFHLLVPGAEGFSHPVRFTSVTYVLGALAFGGVVAALQARFAGTRGRHLVTVAVVLLAAGALAPRAPMTVEPPPRVPEALATVGGDRSPLILLPLDASDFLKYPQIFHQRRLFNGPGLFVPHKNDDDLNALLATNRFVHFLKSVHRPRPNHPPGYLADAEFFVDHGFRYVVVCRYALEYPDVRELAAGPGASTTGEDPNLRAERTLEAALGPPVYTDDDLAVFALPGSGG